jgi:chaperonin GroEL
MSAPTVLGAFELVWVKVQSNPPSGQIVDLPKAGIIDPVKVVRSAVENGASIAAMILTTEALITDLPEKDKAPSMPGGGGMDY